MLHQIRALQRHVVYRISEYMMEKEVAIGTEDMSTIKDCDTGTNGKVDKKLYVLRSWLSKFQLCNL